MPHAEYGLYACPICGFLDEELNHNFQAEPQPEPLGYSSREHLRPDWDSHRVKEAKWKPRYRPDVQERLNQGGKVREDIFADSHWGKPPPEPEKVHAPRPPKPAVKPDVVAARRLLEFTDGMSKKEMRDGFRRLIKQTHPDVSNSPDATTKTIALHDAYELLRERGIAE